MCIAFTAGMNYTVLQMGNRWINFEGGALDAWRKTETIIYETGTPGIFPFLQGEAPRIFCVVGTLFRLDCDF